MNTNEVGKAGLVSGIVIIVAVLIVGYIAHSIAYDFSFVALVLGGIWAGWMVKGKQDDAIGAGAVAGFVYAIGGLFIIYPLLNSAFRYGLFGFFSVGGIIAIVVSVILAAVGGFVGQYLAPKGSMGMGKSSSKKK